MKIPQSTIFAQIRRLNRRLESGEVSETAYARQMTTLLSAISVARLPLAQNLSYFPCRGPHCHIPGELQ